MNYFFLIKIAVHIYCLGFGKHKYDEKSINYWSSVSHQCKLCYFPACSEINIYIY